MENLPIKQGEQAVDPLNAENVPFKQFKHVPPEMEYVPIVQFTHNVFIGFDVNPAEQLKHEPPENEILPTLQAVQEAEFAGDDVPAVQFVQLPPVFE